MDDIAREYYFTAQVAKICGLPEHTIRYYCDEFKITLKKGRGRERYFTKANIQQLFDIKYLLKIRLFTIEGAKKELKNHHHSDEIENVLRVL